MKRKQKRDRLEKEAPELFNGFNELMKYYYKESALDLKQKELIAVGAAVATRCIPCLANHANNAFTHGATREEIIDAAAIEVEFSGDHLLLPSELIFWIFLMTLQDRVVLANDHS